jgi:hypothetical protein
LKVLIVYIKHYQTEYMVMQEFISIPSTHLPPIGFRLSSGCQY